MRLQHKPTLVAPEEYLMRHRALHLSLALSLTVLAGGCAPATSEPALSQREVEAFMQSYEADLRSHNREGVIARYDTAGTVLLGNGMKMAMPFDSIAAMYRAAWNGPDYFAFDNLTYLPAGDSAMVVAGQFRWHDSSSVDTMQFSYVSLVRRTAGGLRISLEDESFAPRRP
jgi:hypothetical protein